MVCEPKCQRIKVALSHRDEGRGHRSQVDALEAHGAGVCLAAGEQDEAGAEKPLAPARPRPPLQRQLQGLILAQLAPLPMACPPSPGKLISLGWQQMKAPELQGPHNLQQQINTSIKSQPSQTCHPHSH